MKQVKELTAQQIFDKVAKHLAKQGKKAYNTKDGCLNFGPGETRCAVGCLVPRSVYRANPRLRRGGVDTIRAALAMVGVNATQHSALLFALLTVHDNSEVRFWPMRLKEVAGKFNLKVPAWLEAVA